MLGAVPTRRNDLTVVAVNQESQSRGPLLLDELEALRLDLLRDRKQLAPHERCGREVREGPAECFDHQPAVVLDLLERAEGFVPADLPRARRAAVVLTDMYVPHMRGDGPDRAGLALFFDVGMK